jgi:DNA-binding MarR family transcriptional regulator
MEYDVLKLKNQLCFPLYACSREIIKKYKPFLDPLNLTYTQYIVMMALWEEDNVSVKYLGERLYLDSGTLTPLLKKMETQGLITRHRCANDERSVIINLTQEGIDLKEKALQIPHQLSACVALTQEQIKIVYQSLYKLLDTLSNKEE